MNKYVSLKNPYTYDGSDVLVNKFDIRDARKLEEMKRDMSSNRAFELWATPIQGDFDLKHLQAIHKNFSLMSILLLVKLERLIYQKVTVDLLMLQ